MKFLQFSTHNGNCSEKTDKTGQSWRLSEVCESSGQNSSDNSARIEDRRQICGLCRREIAGHLQILRQPIEKRVGHEFGEEQTHGELEDALLGVRRERELEREKERNSTM